MASEREAVTGGHGLGNAAAMREALEQAKEIARTIYSTSDRGSSHEDLAEKIVEIANAALAAQPRNCDRFRDWDSAEAEYERLVQEGKAEDGTWCEWLFSVGQYASAQEGGANA